MALYKLCFIDGIFSKRQNAVAQPQILLVNMRPFSLATMLALVSFLFFGFGLETGQCNDLKRMWIYGSPESVTRIADNHNLNIPDGDGMTPLHHAAQYNSGEVVFILLSHNANVNARTSLERTPLMLAAMDNENKDAILPLVAFGADRDAKDILGKTALILATEKGNSWAILELLRYGANPFLKDEDGKTALDYIKSNTSLAGSEARRQLVRYSDPASGLYRPDSAPPQKTALPWRSAIENPDVPKEKPQEQRSEPTVNDIAIQNAIVEITEPALVEQPRKEPEQPLSLPHGAEPTRRQAPPKEPIVTPPVPSPVPQQISGNESSATAMAAPSESSQTTVGVISAALKSVETILGVIGAVLMIFLVRLQIKKEKQNTKM